MSIEFFPQPNIILSIGNINLYFYGAMYALAATFGVILTPFFSRYFPTQISKEQSADIILWGMIGGVLGGRIFYALIYNFPIFIADPLEIIRVWNGGMSIHGGFIGSAIALITYCKKNNFSFFKVIDTLVPSIALGLALGRLGNFVNGELPGRMTDMPWGIDFGDGENRHPSQLYSMVKDLSLFALFSVIIIKNISWKQQKISQYTGMITGLFFCFYGILRFIVEFFRAPDPQVGFIFNIITMGQILSLFACCFGCIVIKKSLSR